MDFTAEVERSLRVLDGAVAVFCAVGGVEPQSETVWHQADKYKVPRIGFINKMDRIGADFFEVCKEIEEKLKASPLPLHIPIGAESDYEGNIDLIRGKEIHWNPDDQGHSFEYRDIRPEMQELAETWRENLIDKLSAYSDEMTELYLEGEDVPEELIYKVLREQTIEQNVLPPLRRVLPEEQGRTARSGWGYLLPPRPRGSEEHRRDPCQEGRDRYPGKDIQGEARRPDLQDPAGQGSRSPLLRQGLLGRVQVGYGRVERQQA